MNDVRNKLHEDAVVLLHAGEHPYAQEEIDRLVELCLRLPHPDGIGDDNKVGVGRIIVDPVDIVRAELGYAPAKVDAPELAQEILTFAASEKAMAFWGEVFDLQPVNLRRAQTNFLYPGGEVGFHNDHESNPDYRISVVMGLSDDYVGGEFLAEVAPGEIRRYRLNKGDVLVAKPELQHAVTRVDSGTRATLVMFMS